MKHIRDIVQTTMLKHKLILIFTFIHTNHPSIAKLATYLTTEAAVNTFNGTMPNMGILIILWHIAQCGYIYGTLRNIDLPMALYYIYP